VKKMAEVNLSCLHDDCVFYSKKSKGRDCMWALVDFSLAGRDRTVTIWCGNYDVKEQKRKEE
jgi:hypothetical protein